MNATLGRLIDAFDASPDAANTVLVLWSDHGWHLGQKLHWRKFTLWEEATHNVMLMIAPGVTQPGQRCHRTVSLLDIYPTLSQLCGLTIGNHLEGRSLVPLLKRPQADWPYPALTTYFRDNHAIRSERWRYIRYADGGEELYDRREDPLEWHNLAARPEYNFVKRNLAQWLPTVNAEPIAHEKGVSEDF